MTLAHKDAAPIRRYSKAEFRPMGTEGQAGFEPLEDGGIEVVGMTPDPREEIYNRIDGPELADALRDRFRDFAEAKAREVEWMIRNGASLAEIGARYVSVHRPISPSLGTGADVAAKYGVSESQQSQSVKHFRRDFGQDFTTLKTRNPDERANIGKGAKKGWSKRRRKRPGTFNGAGPVNKDATESPKDSQTLSGVEVNSGVQS